MSRLLSYALAAALLACVGLAGALWWQSGTIDRLRDHNASLTRSMAALEGARDQARAAAVIAKAEAEKQRKRAEEYERLKDEFRGGGYDEDLPDSFRAILDRLLHGARD